MSDSLRAAARCRWLRRPALLAAAAAALVVTAGPAGASNYTIVANGTPVTATTTAAGEKAKLTFAGTAGNRISLKISAVTMSPKPATGVLVSIQNPNGTTLVSPFSIGSSGTFMEPVTTPATGTYTVILDPASTYKGKATVAVSTVPPDPTASAAIGGAGATLALTAPGQNGTVTFSGTAGQRVSMKLSPVTVSGSPTNSARVSVLNPGATTLVPSFNVGTNGAFAEPVTLPATGTYTVKVDPRTFNVGSATVVLYSVPADQSGTLTVGTPSTVAFASSAPGQNATETFSGTAGQRVSLNLSGVSIGTNPISGTKVSVLKPDMTTLVAATDAGIAGKFIEPVTLPTTGTYTVTVDPQGWNTGSITLGLYTPAADTAAAITAGGAAVVFTASSPGQNGSLTFTGSVNQRVALNLSSVSIGSPVAGTQVSIKKPDGTLLVAAVNVGTTGAFVEPVTLPAAGTYTIRIDPQGANTGSLTANLYTVPADASGTIAAGGSATSTATVPGQNMKLTFTGSANQVVSIKLSGVTIGSNPSSGTQVTLVQPNGSQVGAVTPVGANGAFVDATKLAAAGTYTIRINPQGALTGSVTVNLYTVAADATGAIPTTGSATVATTTSPGQNAKLTFSGTANQLVSLDMSGVTMCATPSGCALVAVLKPDGTTLAGPMSLGTAGSFMDAVKLPATGTYTIKVDPQGANTGSATFRLYVVPADSTFTLTRNAASATNVTTTTPGQNARITFTGTAGDVDTLELGPSICCGVKLTVTAPSGAVVVDQTGTSLRSYQFNGDGNSYPFTLPATGTYTIAVDYLGNGFGVVPIELVG